MSSLPPLMKCQLYCSEVLTPKYFFDVCSFKVSARILPTVSAYAVQYKVNSHCCQGCYVYDC